MLLFPGVVIAGSVEDAKDKAYKPLRDEVKKWVATYKTERGQYPTYKYTLFENNLLDADSLRK